MLQYKSFTIQEDTMPRPTILIIDEDPCMGNALSDILRSRGYEPFVGRKWGEGHSGLNKGPADVVLVDLKHPDMTGPEALAGVRDFYPHSEVVILTGSGTLDPALEAAGTWAYAYILKPYELDQLLLHIRHAVEKQASRAGLRQCEERLEALAREANEELEKARKAAEVCFREKHEFIAEIKKELTTPLSIITGCSMILLDDFGMELSEKHKEFVQHILNSGRALQHVMLYKHEFLEANYGGARYHPDATEA